MHTNTPTLKEMVSALIATPSTSSTDSRFDTSNQDVIHLLANWLEPLGFTIKITPVVGHIGKVNLIATLGEGSNGLLLSGHSDTVPFDEHLWQFDPFKMTENEDRWYGLGSCDMKSFFALAIEASRSFQKSDFKQPLTIMATADEESSMSGARQLAPYEVAAAKFAVIGEPTDLKPITRHKGIMMLKLRVDGTSGHSSDPALGKNAIEGMHQAISELMAYKRELVRNFSDEKFAVSYPTLNFGCIHGGDNPNRICDHSELSFDLRNLPSMDMGGFTEMLQARIANKISEEGFTCSVELLHPPVPAFDNSASDLSRTIEELRDQSAGSVAFGTEAPFLSALNLDTVVIGPGSINQAHQPNEYLPLNQITPTVDLLSKLISRYCMN